MDDQYIYVDDKGEAALTPYLRLPLEHPEIYPPLAPANRVLLAYSAKYQGTPLAIGSICVKHAITPVFITVPTLSVNAISAFFAKLAVLRQENASNNRVFIIKHCERNFVRGDYHADPDFFQKLSLTMETHLGDGRHIAVACLGIVPTAIPAASHQYVPIQCYFGPPNTEQREKLFWRFFMELARHCANVSTLHWIHFDIDQDCTAFLADHSASRSVGEIREFVVKVWYSLLGRYHSHQAAGSSPFLVDQTFLRSHLVEGEFLNQTNPDDAEDMFRAYAGEPQSHHAKPAVASPFASALPPPAKKSRTGTKKNDEPRSIVFGGDE